MAGVNPYQQPGMPSPWIGIPAQNPMMGQMPMDQAFAPPTDEQIMLAQIASPTPVAMQQGAKSIKNAFKPVKVVNPAPKDSGQNMQKSITDYAHSKVK